MKQAREAARSALLTAGPDSVIAAGYNRSWLYCRSATTRVLINVQKGGKKPEGNDL